MLKESRTGLPVQQQPGLRSRFDRLEQHSISFPIISSERVFRDGERVDSTTVVSFNFSISPLKKPDIVCQSRKKTVKGGGFIWEI